ncbi:MAG: alpha/beta fold hydrolase [Candidatus Peribacteraceae bacterium]|nr:alpha/beta fold hydrolase [Candidatus Peribacteraceae bacterium]
MVSPLPKIIFLHGNSGEGVGHYWFPYAAREFRTLGFEVRAKDFPDAHLARKSIWLPFLEKECGADENSILIGHSSGAIAVMRWAEQHQIVGSVLVGAYYTDTGSENERLSGYFDDPWDFEAIRRNQQWIIQFASVDDPFFPIEEPRLVSRELQTEYHEFTNRGHFFEKEFPELIEAVQKKCSIA